MVSKLGRPQEVEDLTGRKYGLLEIVRYAGWQPYNSGTHHFWEAKCECGNVVSVPRTALHSKRSCGRMCEANRITRTEAAARPPIKVDVSGTSCVHDMDVAHRTPAPRATSCDINWRCMLTYKVSRFAHRLSVYLCSYSKALEKKLEASTVARANYLQRSKDIRDANKEELKKARQRYAADNREAQRVYQRAYRQKNLEKVRLKEARYRARQAYSNDSPEIMKVMALRQGIKDIINIKKEDANHEEHN